MINFRLNLKIAKLVEVRELTRLIGPVKVERLGANKNGYFSKTTKTKRVGRAGRVERTRGKKKQIYYY